MKKSIILIMGLILIAPISVSLADNENRNSSDSPCLNECIQAIKDPDSNILLEGYNKSSCIWFCKKKIYDGGCSKEADGCCNPFYCGYDPDCEINGTYVYKLPDTGQTQSYTSLYGEDSDYLINPPSYKDNNDGTVTDNNTELMWQQDYNSGTFNWYEAIGEANPTHNPDGATNVCGDLTLGNYFDWRLPTINDLHSIANYYTVQPVIDETYFPNVGAGNKHTWSSTSRSGDNTKAWYFNFSGNGAHHFGKTYAYLVRCVRDTSLPGPSLTDNGNGTVFDGSTGLTWQQGEGGTMDWESALNYCEQLSVGEKEDWRLPNIKELRSIVDDTRISPAIDLIHFPDTAPLGIYWSSTSRPSDSTLALTVGFHYGDSYWIHNKTSFYLVRCVRGGN